MSISYNNGIPDAPNNPSNDQPLMKQNTDSIDQLIAIDHVSFNSSNGGFHKKVSLNNVATTSAPTDPVSIVYTDYTTINPAKPQLFFRNSNSPYPIGAIKAFGSFVTAAAPTFVTQQNCASIARAVNNYTITLNANVTSGNNVAVFVMPQVNTLINNYSFAAGVLSIVTNMPDGIQINFLILQI